MFVEFNSRIRTGAAQDQGMPVGEEVAEADDEDQDVHLRASYILSRGKGCTK